jgi:Skp family chaperone for outer membrane proteins
VYTEDSADRACEQEHSPPLSSRDNSRSQQLILDQGECHGQDDESEALHRAPRNIVHDTTTAENIKTLEEKIASFTKIIEKQTLYTPSCDDKVESDDNPSSATIKLSGDAIQSSTSTTLEARNLAMCQRQRKAAIVLLETIIENIGSRNRHWHTQRMFAFLLWRLSTRSYKLLMRAKEHATESEKKWQIDAQQLVNRAVNEEAAKGKNKLEVSKQKYNAMISKLQLKVKSLEGHLEEEGKKKERSSEAINTLKAEVQRVEETSKKDVAQAEERARRAEIEADSLRKELQHRKEAMDEEEYVNSSEILRLTRSHEEVMELAAINAKQVNQLKLEVGKKDVSLALALMMLDSISFLRIAP